MSVPFFSHFAESEDAESQKFLTNGIPGRKKYEEYEEEYHPGTTSFGMSVFNLSNAIMGSGILGLSYAMANTGIVMFVILLLGVAILSLYSVHLLLLTAKEGGYLGYTSGFSLTCMVFFLGVMIYKKSQIPCPLPDLDHFTSNHTFNVSTHAYAEMLQNKTSTSDINIMMEYSVSQGIFHKEDIHEMVNEAHDNEMCRPKYFVFNSQTAYTIPILAFAFVCHPEVLPIYSELKDRSRKKMQNVSNISIMAMLIMYFLAALFGYLTFYDNVEPELLHTFTKVYKFDTLLLMVRLAVLTAVTLTVPIVLFPIRSSITTLLFNGREFSWLRHMLIAAALLAFNNLLVIFVPTIRDIFGFIGASAATLLIFILPASFYLRLVKSIPFRSPQKIGALVFLTVGVIFMIGSMSLIITDWIHNPPGSGGH
ncbi:S38A4 protein, partial [Polypterus senegalus]